MQIKKRCGTAHTHTQLKHEYAFCFMSKYVNGFLLVHHIEHRKKEKERKKTVSFDFVSLKSHKSTSLSGKYRFQFVEFR